MTDMKFAVGDKVRVTTSVYNYQDIRYGDLGVVVGALETVTYPYRVLVGEHAWLYAEDELEAIDD